MSERMILTSECENCKYSSIDDSNKARVKIYCSEKEKTYYWGQYVPCENINKRKGDEK